MIGPGAVEAPALAISGPVTRAEVGLWRGALIQALDSDPALRIDLADAGPWDVFGVQLLLAARHSAERRGGTLHLDRVPRVLGDVLDRAGLADAILPLISGWRD